MDVKKDEFGVRFGSMLGPRMGPKTTLLFEAISNFDPSAARARRGHGAGTTRVTDRGGGESPEHPNT